MARVVVVGLGEVGRPLLETLARTYEVHGKDVESPPVSGPFDVMHVCYPFQIADFIGTTAAYVRELRPGLVVVDSTVEPGTTRRIAERTGVAAAYSPVRGKHTRMREHLLHYAKFVAGVDEAATTRAAEHFRGAGLKVETMSRPEA